jgi:hypothetical protein
MGEKRNVYGLLVGSQRERDGPWRVLVNVVMKLLVP